MSSSVRFVLIDDDEIFNFLHHSVIKEVFPQAEILSFQSSMEAKEHLGAHPVIRAVFLIDIRMPELNGFELVEYFESLPKEHFSGSSFYFLTSSLDERDKTRAGNYGLITGYLEKPISIEKIKEVGEKQK
jgi:response regulator RpfG family c-di-GMP phosphodiesterase